MQPFETKLLFKIGERHRSRIVLMGVGNELRHDDGVAQTIIRQLEGCNSDTILAVDCQDAPENFTSFVKRFNPTHIILIDAVDFRANPGDFEIFEIHDIESVRITTHKTSLAVMASYLRQETSAHIFIIGIQPADSSFGIGLSQDVKKAVNLIVGSLRTVLNCSTQKNHTLKV
ncbi:MAG TPA: hydrogenase 3 maturation endopeptidase HyCI [Candidatus Acidoferrales bacterium]|nr:hydrogenase 3 maturation endopeptidase HyCI [Candidatus Acidoferrales bacterium]